MPKQANDTRVAIGRSALFKSLAPAVISRLAEAAKNLSPRRGAQIYRRGERCSGVYIVMSGRIMLSVSVAPDANKVTGLIGPGGHFGLAAAILGAPQAVSAEALSDSTLLLIPRAVLLECAADNAAFGLQIATILSHEQAVLTDDIEAASLRSGRQRVAGYLLEIAGSNGAQARPFALPAKKSIIASRLSLTPEYFSRMLHELIVTGSILVEGRQVTVLNRARLQEAGEISAQADT
jgi:CRP/FNR family transcriptional regulator, dissimilatory nitrate respiration regulator